MGIAEEGRHAEGVEAVVAGELGAIVEGNGMTQGQRDGGEERAEEFGDIVGCLVGRLGGEEQPRVALMDGEDRLTVSGEEDEIGFPMTRGAAIGGIARPFSKGLSEVLCLRPSASLDDEPVAEDDGKLGPGLEPLARRPFPLVGLAIEDQI